MKILSGARKVGAWQTPAIAFGFVLLVLSGVIAVWGPGTALEGDPAQYAAIGKSLASGNGYKDTAGPFPDKPAYDRMPGWPTLIAVGLKLAPWASVPTVLRGTNAFLLALAAALFTVLQRQLGVGTLLATLGGIALVLSPAVVVFVLNGLSEVLFILCTVAAIVAILAGPRWHWVGAGMVGLTPLVRSNFVLMPFALVGLLLFFPQARKQLGSHSLAKIGLFASLALAPTVLWAFRNYTLTDRFPLLSSLEGETLYGGNNASVANDLALWGYGITPDLLPGEPILKPDLAIGHDDLYLNDYYHNRAMAWIRSHPAELPRLMVGKMIRGFVPVPWVPLAASWAAFSYRWLLDILFIVLARWWWSAIDSFYFVFCLAMLAIAVLTTLVYFGTYRYVHPTELFMIPFITIGIQRWWESRGIRDGAHRS